MKEILTVRELIKKLMDLPMDKSVKIVTPENVFIDVSYIEFNKTHDEVFINTENE